MNRIYLAIFLSAFLAPCLNAKDISSAQAAVNNAKDAISKRIEKAESERSFEESKDALVSAIKMLEEKNSQAKKEAFEAKAKAESTRATAKSLSEEISRKKAALNTLNTELDKRFQELKDKLENNLVFGKEGADIAAKLSKTYTEAKDDAAKKLRALYSALDSLLALDSKVSEDSSSISYGKTLVVEKSGGKIPASIKLQKGAQK